MADLLKALNFDEMLESIYTTLKDGAEDVFDGAQPDVEAFLRAFAGDLTEARLAGNKRDAERAKAEMATAMERARIRVNQAAHDKWDSYVNGAIKMLFAVGGAVL